MGWPAELRQGLRATGQAPFPEEKVLIVHGGFVGLGSHARVLKIFDVKFQEVLGAERKPHAIQFLRQNGLNHYKEFASILQPRAMDCVCCPGPCPVPQQRPDIAFLGFDCQPFSSMRAAHMRTLPPSKHEGFASYLKVLQFLRTVRPRVAVVENSMGFATHQLDAMRDEVNDIFSVGHIP